MASTVLHRKGKMVKQNALRADERWSDTVEYEQMAWVTQLRGDWWIGWDKKSQHLAGVRGESQKVHIEKEWMRLDGVIRSEDSISTNTSRWHKTTTQEDKKKFKSNREAKRHSSARTGRVQVWSQEELSPLTFQSELSQRCKHGGWSGKWGQKVETQNKTDNCVYFLLGRHLLAPPVHSKGQRGVATTSHWARNNKGLLLDPTNPFLNPPFFAAAYDKVIKICGCVF